MSDTLSNKKRKVKNSSVDRNTRPARPQPNVTESVSRGSCDTDRWLPQLLCSTTGEENVAVPDVRSAGNNPRPTRSFPRFSCVCGPRASNYEWEGAECVENVPDPAKTSCESSEPKAERRKYPPGIRKLQRWLGVRGGVSPKLRKICDSGDEALILNQLVCYWFGRERKRNRIRARVLRDRHRWVAKSFKEWAAELGMTEKQARRCIAALAKKELIVVRTWRFQGHNTTHVRLFVGKIAEAAGYEDADEEL